GARKREAKCALAEQRHPAGRRESGAGEADEVEPAREAPPVDLRLVAHVRLERAGVERADAAAERVVEREVHALRARHGEPDGGRTREGVGRDGLKEEPGRHLLRREDGGGHHTLPRLLRGRRRGGAQREGGGEDDGVTESQGWTGFRLRLRPVRSDRGLCSNPIDNTKRPALPRPPSLSRKRSNTASDGRTDTAVSPSPTHLLLPPGVPPPFHPHDAWRRRSGPPARRPGRTARPAATAPLGASPGTSSSSRAPGSTTSRT